jgi:hypothetical protein
MAMRGEQAVALRAETPAIASPVLRVHAQAGVVIPMKRAKIQPAPSGGSGAIEAQQIRDIVGLIVLGDGDAYAMSVIIPRRSIYFWPRRSASSVVSIGA